MKSACACTTKQIYRTDKNNVHLHYVTVLLYRQKKMYTCTTLQINRTDKNNVYPHDITDWSYRQKQCIPALRYRFIVQIKTVYTCATLPFYRTDKNSAYLHDFTDLSYRLTKTACTCLAVWHYRCFGGRTTKIYGTDQNGLHLFGGTTLQMYRRDKKQCASYRMALMNIMPWWTFPLEVTLKDLRSLGGLSAHNHATRPADLWMNTPLKVTLDELQYLGGPVRLKITLEDL